jgi:hypothetical protein
MLAVRHPKVPTQVGKRPLVPGEAAALHRAAGVVGQILRGMLPAPGVEEEKLGGLRLEKDEGVGGEEVGLVRGLGGVEVHERRPKVLEQAPVRQLEALSVATGFGHEFVAFDRQTPESCLQTSER